MAVLSLLPLYLIFWHQGHNDRWDRADLFADFIEEVGRRLLLAGSRPAAVLDFGEGVLDEQPQPIDHLLRDPNAQTASFSLGSDAHGSAAVTIVDLDVDVSEQRDRGMLGGPIPADLS